MSCVRCSVVVWSVSCAFYLLHVATIIIIFAAFSLEHSMRMANFLQPSKAAIEA